MQTSDRATLILEESARLFAKQGFHATTVREIADAVGLTSGAIFHHFDSKREMLVEAIREGTVRAHRLVEQRLALVEDPAERFRLMVATHLCALHEDASHPLMVVSATEWRTLTDAERDSVVGTRDAYETRWQAVIDELVHTGKLTPDPLLRLFVLGALNWTVFWFRPDERMTTAELAASFCDLLLPPSTHQTDRDARACALL